MASSYLYLTLVGWQNDSTLGRVHDLWGAALNPTVVNWDNIGIMEKKMETTITGFRVQ